MSKVSAIRDFKSLKIYIDGLLHLELPMNNHCGVQSWLEGSNKQMYFIEFYRKEGNSILLEYDDKDIWCEILKLIDYNI